MSDRLNVLVQSSDYYAPFCGVTLQSLFQNNTNIDDIKVFLISDGIGENNLRKFEELTRNFGRQIHIIDGCAIGAMLSESGVAECHGSYTTYFKMFASDFIDEDIERILYLDSDLIVEDSLKDLITFDMNGRILAMTLDLASETYRRSIGHSMKDHYCAGVILFDLKRWREEKCEQRIIEHLKNVRSNYYTADQDILNLVLDGQIAQLELKYDLGVDLLSFKKLNSVKLAFGVKNFYDDEEFERARRSPVIYHCSMAATVTRPWYLGSDNPVTEKWDGYLLDSPWRAYQKTKENGSILHRFQRTLYRILPEKIFAVLNNLCTDIMLHIRLLKE